MCGYYCILNAGETFVLLHVCLHHADMVGLSLCVIACSWCVVPTVGRLWAQLIPSWWWPYVHCNIPCLLALIA